MLPGVGRRGRPHYRCCFPMGGIVMPPGALAGRLIREAVKGVCRQIAPTSLLVLNVSSTNQATRRW